MAGHQGVYARLRWANPGHDEVFIFLQAEDVGPGGLQPGKQVREALVDVVDVQRGELHSGAPRCGG